MKTAKVKSSLFRKYLLIMLTVIFVSFAILGGSLTFFVSKYWIAEKEKLLQENAASVSSIASDLIGSGYMERNREGSVLLICNTLTLTSNAIDSDVFITDMNGRVIYCKEMLGANLIVSPGRCPLHAPVTVPADIIALTAGRGTYSEIGNLGGVYGSSHFIVADAIMVGGRCVGLVLAVQEFSIVANPYVLAIIRMFAVSSLLALLISFITVYYMSYKFVKPLQQMSEATRKYAEGDFSYRVRLKGDDELASLAEAFNSMARDLATLEASRRSFVANVSHELKTPMTTIGGFIDGILDGTIEAEKRDSYLRLVSDEIRRLSRLVTGMLEMSKMESGEIDLKRRRFNISEQIFKTVLSFERSIQDKMIDIVGLEQIEDVFVNADEDLINQVIYNLIDNAVKFTPRGGTITLTAYLQGENAVVKVRNTGAGVSSEEIGRIFERFYKVDKSRSEDVRGAGLGLYIVKSIVELHGGNISVESVENEYTQFTFYLPVG